MHQQDLAIVRGLVAVAWADGRVAAEEREVIDAVLDAFHATPSEAREMRKYAETPRTLDDIQITDLSLGDRSRLLQYSVLLSHVDGALHAKEVEILKTLCERLRIEDAEAKGIIAAATQRAKELSELL